MRTLVVYDSVYGNTEIIARSIAGAFAPGEVDLKRAADTNAAALGQVDLLIVGAPTQGGRGTAVVQEFLNSLPERTLKGKSVAAFDTRMGGKRARAGMRLLVGVFGFAAGRIAKDLEQKGGYLIVPPEGFIVKGREGPLEEGEPERSVAWAKGIIEKQRAKLTG